MRQVTCRLVLALLSGVLFTSAIVGLERMGMRAALGQMPTSGELGSPWYCPTTGGPTECFYCTFPHSNPPESPVNPQTKHSYGCENGKPPEGMIVSKCLKKQTETAGCTWQLILCGDYFDCMDARWVGVCSPSYYICSGINIMDP